MKKSKLIVLALVLVTVSAVPACMNNVYENIGMVQKVYASPTSATQNNVENAWKELLPAVSETPVYELTNGSNIIYTLNDKEKETLIDNGWTYNGPAFYSSTDPDSLPVYRLHDDAGNFIYSLANKINGYTVDGTAFFVQNTETVWTTMTLEQDQTQTVVVTAGQHLRIDLNGHNISSTSGPAILVQKGGTVEVTGNGNLTASGSEPVVRNNGNAILSSGHYENNGNYCIINHGNMVISGGEFTHTDKNCVSSLINTGYQNYYSGNAANGYVQGQNYSSPVLVITGGDFHGGRWLIKSDDNGRTYLVGGTYYDARYSVIKNWATIEMIGGKYVSREDGESYGLITNGHVTSANDEMGVDPGTMTIYGGTYYPGDYLFYPANNGDGNSLVYGNIIIHNMTVTKKVPLSNDTWSVFANHNYNQITGVENINWAE